MEMSEKKVSLSGIQSSGTPTIGNYIGALQYWPQMQDDYDGIYFVADSHSLTVRREPEEQFELTRQLFALLLALGIDPEKSLVFVQSQVPEHFELSWIINCHTYFGELNRMTQFKDKSEQHADNINAGLFTYPALMAADVLIYQTDVVPVGDDQKQHLELTRDIAQRMNNRYGDLFTVPEPSIPKEGARIMSLADPTIKMSKSDPNPRGYVLLTEEPKSILKKFRSAVTDSDRTIRYQPDNPDKAGINNLLTIYSVATNTTIAAAEKEFAGKGYGDFKTAVGEAVVEMLAPIQQEYTRYMDDPAQLSRLAQDCATKASARAQLTLDRVKKAIGYYR